MPEVSRLLLVVALAGGLAACTATTPDAPSAATDDGAAPAASERGEAAGAAGESGLEAGGAPTTELADLDPQTRRRVELWQEAMRQIEPCLRPRLAEIDDVDEAGVVAVQVEYDDAGTPLNADLQEGAQDRMADNETYRAVVNAILNSVQECAPLTDMPEEEFDTWRLFPVVIRPRST
ncbi:MAG: hypothetical protein GVY33_08575 [Alphaproteobacteria bacterium]|jgi:hypothetical protein|nr:hypothetical protein [Alphaproteobacteria bacterium]